MKRNSNLVQIFNAQSKKKKQTIWGIELNIRRKLLTQCNKRNENSWIDERKEKTKNIPLTNAERPVFHRWHSDFRLKDSKHLVNCGMNQIVNGIRHHFNLMALWTSQRQTHSLPCPPHTINSSTFVFVFSDVNRKKNSKPRLLSTSQMKASTAAFERSVNIESTLPHLDFMFFFQFEWKSMANKHPKIWSKLTSLYAIWKIGEKKIWATM